MPPRSHITLGLPKGSLQEPTIEYLRKAGWRIRVNSRSYRPTIDDDQIEPRLLRAQEIGRYVHAGYLDCGITGRDWIAENAADIEVIADLHYSRATAANTRWVLVVPQDSPIEKITDLQGKRIATEAINLTRSFLATHGVTADIEFSWGATEVKVPELVDAIVDITETGHSLRANNLRIIATIMESWPQLIMNRAAFADEKKRAKVENIALLLQGALAARDKVGLKMNAPDSSLANLVKILPSMRNPTISPLYLPEANENWVAVETVVSEHIVRDVIPQLKKLGVEDIIEYSLNKIVE